jgi:hypothetical protein
MGNCTYCHKKAGLFKNEHVACAEAAKAARVKIRGVVMEAITSDKLPEDVMADVSIYQREGRLTDGEVKSLILDSADSAARKVALDSPVDNDRFERIGAFFLAADPEWLTGDVMKRVKCSGFLATSYSNTLYQVLHRQIPYSHLGGFDDFRFEVDEHPILRRYASLDEYRSVPTGSSFQSVGLPIGGGLYYRIGASQPRANVTGLVPVDDGLIVITTKAIIYSGQRQNFRLPYTSILRLESFVDGFGIHQNYGGGKVFLPSPLGSMDEGWYFSNLVSALMKW